MKGALGFVCTLLALSGAFIVGVIQFALLQSPKSETEALQWALMMYAIHSVTFWLVAGWIVRKAWSLSEPLSVVLGMVLVTFEMLLVTRASWLGLDFTAPRWALSHIALYVAAPVVVGRWRPRANTTQLALDD